MNQFREQGKQFTKGAIDAIISFLCWWLIGILLITIIAAWLGWQVDDSDKDGFNRSGLKVHVDHKTGIEYLSDGRGGLIRRETK